MRTRFCIRGFRAADILYDLLSDMKLLDKVIVASFSKDVILYLEENYPQKMRESSRFASLSSDMHANAIHLLQYIHTEQQSGKFRPVAFEEKIGMGGRVPPLKVEANNGKTYKLHTARGGNLPRWRSYTSHSGIGDSASLHDLYRGYRDRDDLRGD